MSRSVTQLKSELRKLNYRQRNSLALFLIETLDGQIDPDVSPAWEAEAARRADEIRMGKVRCIPAEKVFAESRKRFP